MGPVIIRQRRKTRPDPTSLVRIPGETNCLGRVDKETNGPCPGDPVEAQSNSLKNAVLLIRSTGEISSKLPKATPDDEEGRIRSTGAVQQAQQCRSIGHGELLRPDRSGNRSSECTECGDRVGSTFTTMKPTRQIFGAHHPKHSLKPHKKGSNCN